MPQAGGEAELAMQMWWRAAALESLQAYVAGPLRKADPMEQANLARSVAALLQPTLAAVSAHAPLQARNDRPCFLMTQLWVDCKDCSASDHQLVAGGLQPAVHRCPIAYSSIVSPMTS